MAVLIDAFMYLLIAVFVILVGVMFLDIIVAFIETGEFLKFVRDQRQDQEVKDGSEKH